MTWVALYKHPHLNEVNIAESMRANPVGAISAICKIGRRFFANRTIRILTRWALMNAPDLHQPKGGKFPAFSFNWVPIRRKEIKGVGFAETRDLLDPKWVNKDHVPELGPCSI